MIQIESLPNEMMEKIVCQMLDNGSTESLKTFSSLMLVNKRMLQICQNILKFNDFSSFIYNFNTGIEYKNLLNRVSNLKIEKASINLTSMEQLNELLDLAPDLSSLTISDSDDLLIQFDNLKFLGNFYNLKKLSINFLSIGSIQDEWISVLVEYCPRLKHLELKKSGYKTVDHCISFLEVSATALKILSALELNHIGINRSDIASCKKLINCDFSKVETLDLSDSAILDEDFFDILKNFPLLKKLVLDQSNVDGMCIDPWWEEEQSIPFHNFPHIPTLETLDFFDHAFINLNSLVNVKQLFHIKSLASNVPGNIRWDDWDIEIPEIEREQAFIDFAKNFKAIRELKLCFDSDRDSCEYLKHLQKMPLLTNLTIANAQFTQSDLFVLSQTVKIETLIFQNVTATQYLKDFHQKVIIEDDIDKKRVKNIKINQAKKAESSDFSLDNLIFSLFFHFPKVEKIILNLKYDSLADFNLTMKLALKKLPDLKYLVLNEGKDNQKVYNIKEIKRDIKKEIYKIQTKINSAMIMASSIECQNALTKRLLSNYKNYLSPPSKLKKIQGQERVKSDF